MGGVISVLRIFSKSMAVDSSQIQIRLVTKLPNLAVPDVPITVPFNIEAKGLSKLVAELLKESGHEETFDLDFVVNGELLRLPLGSFLADRGVSVELCSEVEYVSRHPTPEPYKSVRHDDWVAAVHAHPNGKWVATGCYDNSIHIWSVAGKHLDVIEGHSGPVKCVEWLGASDEGRELLISCSQDQTVMCSAWGGEKSKTTSRWVGRGHERAVDSVAVHKNGKQIASGGWDNMLKIWNMDADGTESEEGHPKSAKRDKSAIPTRTPRLTLTGHTEAVSRTQWLADSVATAAMDHTLRLWDVEKGIHSTSVQGHKAFLDADWKEDATVVAASADRHIRLYDTRVKDSSAVQSTFSAASGWVSSVRWSKTEERLFASGGYDNTLRLWDTRSPKAALYEMRGHTDKVLAIDWSCPGLLISGGADNNVKILRTFDRIAADGC